VMNLKPIGNLSGLLILCSRKLRSDLHSRKLHAAWTNKYRCVCFDASSRNFTSRTNSAEKCQQNKSISTTNSAVRNPTNLIPR
jgi:hypothetical protein